MSVPTGRELALAVVAQQMAQPATDPLEPLAQGMLGALLREADPVAAAELRLAMSEAEWDAHIATVVPLIDQLEPLVRALALRAQASLERVRAQRVLT